MYPTKLLGLARFLIGAAAAVFISTGSALSVAAESAVMGDRASPYGRLVVADAHPYRHCHNLSKRTYCHKADRLPQNWPPNTGTPHRSGTETDSRKECVPGSKSCASDLRYGKG